MCHGHDLQVNETLDSLGETEQVSIFRAEVDLAEPVYWGEESEDWPTWTVVAAAIEAVVDVGAAGVERLVVVGVVAVVAETVVVVGAAAEVEDVRRVC